MRWKNLFGQRLKTRLAPAVVNERVDSDNANVGVFTVVIRSLERIDRALLVTETNGNERETVLRDIAGLGRFDQAPENLLRLLLLTRSRIGRSRKASASGSSSNSTAVRYSALASVNCPCRASSR